MFNKKKKVNLSEINLTIIKSLKYFEQIEAERDKFFQNVYYMRVPGGLIRTVSNQQGVSQLFISLPDSFFIPS